MSDETITPEAVPEQETSSASLPTIYQIAIIENDVIDRTQAGNFLGEEFIEVEREVYETAKRAIALHGAWYRNGEVVPMPAPPPPPIVISAETLFFDRMTDVEYDDLDASVKAGETARVYRGWAAATSFTEGTALWALMVRHLKAIGATAERISELLGA